MSQDEEDIERLFGTSALVLFRALPGHMHTATAGYLLWGHPIGGFLTAVMSNDFKETVGRADYVNEMALKRWAEFLYGVMPISPQRSYGSPEIVKEWQRIGGIHGLAAKLEKKNGEAGGDQADRRPQEQADPSSGDASLDVASSDRQSTDRI